MASNKLLWVGLVVVGAVVGSVPLFLRDNRSYSFKTAVAPESMDLSTSQAAIAATGGSSAFGASTLGNYAGTDLSREKLSSEEKSKLFEAESKVYETLEEILATRYLTSYFEKYQKENGLADMNAAREHYFAKNSTVTDAEVNNFLQEMKDNPGLQKIPERERAGQVRAYLENRNKGNAMRELVQAGRDKGQIQVAAAKPVEPRLDVTDGGNYFMGPKNAKVTIVEFTDYQCPFCARAVPNLQAVMKKYDGKVRWVVRDFPLREIHPEALPSAIAANCAGEQGKYFEMHNKLFENYSTLNAGNYTTWAKELGLDADKFSACQKDPKQEAEVLADQAEGTKLGVNGTPAFYVNGRKIAGAADVPTLSRMIEEELKVN